MLADAKWLPFADAYVSGLLAKLVADLRIFARSLRYRTVSAQTANEGHSAGFRAHAYGHVHPSDQRKRILHCRARNYDRVSRRRQALLACASAAGKVACANAAGLKPTIKSINLTIWSVSDG